MISEKKILEHGITSKCFSLFHWCCSILLLSDLKPDQVRCSEHSDYGSITLLVQDSQGLEVR